MASRILKRINIRRYCTNDKNALSKDETAKSVWIKSNTYAPIIQGVILGTLYGLDERIHREASSEMFTSTLVGCGIGALTGLFIPKITYTVLTAWVLHTGFYEMFCKKK
jgi:hypothetical protein